MQLYLVRHATALERSPDLQDSERPLSPEGRDRLLGAIAGLQRLGIGFDGVLTSPLLRAQHQ